MTITSPIELPLEILTRILDLVVASEVPFWPQYAIKNTVHLEDIRSIDDDTELRRRYRDIKNTADLYDIQSDDDITQLRFERTGPWTTVKDRILRSQQTHLQDWVIMNSTCQCMRSVGRQAFFRQKVLDFELSSLMDFCAGKARISQATQALAIASARTVVIQMRPNGADFQRLPRVQRQLLSARKLGICLEPLKHNNDLPDLVQWSSLPQRLEQCLRAIDLDMDSVEVEFLLAKAHEEQQSREASLPDSVYQALGAYATFMQRTRAASKAKAISIDY